MDEIAAVAGTLTRLVVPSLVVSVAAFYLLRLVSSLSRFALASALASAFLVGYLAFPEGAPLKPERYWHWLPYLAMMGALAGSIAAIGVLGFWRHAATLIASCCGAWLLVPTWPALASSRALIVSALSVSFVVLSSVLSGLARRIPSREFLTYVSLASIAVAICTAAATSLKFGQLAAIVAASVAGCCTVSWLSRIASKDLIAMIPCYVLLAGGVTFVTFIEPDPPFYEVPLILAAPVAAWIGSLGPLARLEGAKATAVRVGFVVVALVVMCGCALI